MRSFLPLLSIAVLASIAPVAAHAETKTKPEPQVLGYGQGLFTVGESLYQTGFEDPNDWLIQIQPEKNPSLVARVAFGDGMLDLYMPGRGCTAWLKEKFSGPIAVVYQVLCPNETLDDEGIQARDINNFWHAFDPMEFDGIFDGKSYAGSFGTYHKMHGYYASTGGGGSKGNQTTRFRRYPRQLDGKDIPHIALNDKDGKSDYLITPGKWHTVQLVAYDGTVQYIVDGKVVYQIREGDPILVEGRTNEAKSTSEQTYTLEDFPAYTEGYVGLRLVGTHHQYRNFGVYRLLPAESASNSQKP